MFDGEGGGLDAGQNVAVGFSERIAGLGHVEYSLEVGREGERGRGRKRGREGERGQDGGEKGRE